MGVLYILPKVIVTPCATLMAEVLTLRLPSKVA